MRLMSVSISGYRGYAQEICIQVEGESTVLAGRNDAGKSSVFEALELFFNNGRPDPTDFSVGENLPIVITCEFDDLPSEIRIDAERTTSLRDEYLLDATGRLVLRKTWTRSKAGQPTREAIANHPVFEEGKDPLNAKIADLKRLAEELGIDLNSIPDRRVSGQYRQRIWETALAEGKASLLSGPVQLATEDGKAVGSALESYMPIYHLFRADRPGTEADQLAQDPAKEAIKLVLERHEKQLSTLSRTIEDEVTELLADVVGKLHEIDTNLAETLRPVDPKPNWTKAFSSLQFVDQNEVPLSKRGSGTRRLVLLSFFRATAEKELSNQGHEEEHNYHRGVITAVEEPETALHADLQSDIVAALQDIGELAHRQVLLTTHSTNLLRLVPARSIRYITNTESGKRVVALGSDGDATDLLRSLNASLGVFTDHNVRCFVLVEGRNDIQSLKLLSHALADVDGSEISSLAELEAAGLIAFMPMGGGGNASLWASNLSPFRRPEVHIMDSDRESPEHPLKQEMSDLLNRADASRNVFVLDRRELENYLDLEVIEGAYAHFPSFQTTFSQLRAHGAGWNYIDIPRLVTQAAHEANPSASKAWSDLSEEAIGSKESKTKKTLTRLFGDEGLAERIVGEAPDLIEALRKITAECGAEPTNRHNR